MENCLPLVKLPAFCPYVKLCSNLSGHFLTSIHQAYEVKLDCPESESHDPQSQEVRVGLQHSFMDQEQWGKGCGGTLRGASSVFHAGFQLDWKKWAEQQGLPLLPLP